MKKIKLENITEYQDKQCKLFANYSCRSSLDEYAKRNQNNTEKIINDIYNGKKGEFLVYNYLISKERKLQSPDLNIYLRNIKSFDADLYLQNINIHVKTHVVNDNFPISWLFQKKDPLVKCKNENDYLALVVLDDAGNYMMVKKIFDVYFDQPVKESLKKDKLCIYENQLNK